MGAFFGGGKPPGKVQFTTVMKLQREIITNATLMSLVVKHQLINALLDLNHSGSMYFLVSTLSSSMHFWVFISSHRCTLPSFLKLSMHFWVSEWHHRCTSGFKVHLSMYFWGADVVGRCTLWIQVDFIDALLGFHRNSSMHFWVFSYFQLNSSMYFWIFTSIHRCTLLFLTAIIDVHGGSRCIDEC